jgi:hypothetical protein
MSQVTLQGNASGTGVFTIAAPNSNTNRTLNLPDAAGDVVLTTATQTLTNKSISGAQINSGTVDVARLGSGTPGTGNFLRGDGSWQTVPASAPSTTDVLNATAGATVGAVGTYAFLGETTITTTAPGGTRAGSGLRYASGGTNTSWADSSNFGSFNKASGASTNTPSGTWRCMGDARAQSSSYFGNTFPATLWLRIS